MTGMMEAALLEERRAREAQYTALATSQQTTTRAVNDGREEFRAFREWAQRSAKAQSDDSKAMREEIRAMAAHILGPMRDKLDTAARQAGERLTFREEAGAFLVRHRVVGAFLGIATTMVLSLFNLALHALAHR